MTRTDLHPEWVQYLRAVFDGIPTPAFVVDGDMQIFDFNSAAELFLGPEPAAALYQKSGEAFHCIHSDAFGCGKAEACKDCVIRKSVQKVLSGGVAQRQLHKAKLRRGSRTSRIDLLVTASLLPYTESPRALLVLENLTELKKRLRVKSL